MTDEEARVVFSGMTHDELVGYAIEYGKPYEGLTDSELVDVLVGACPKCKGSQMKVTYEGNNNLFLNNAQKADCPECDKKKNNGT